MLHSLPRDQRLSTLNKWLRVRSNHTRSFPKADRFEQSTIEGINLVNSRGMQHIHLQNSIGVLSSEWLHLRAARVISLAVEYDKTGRRFDALARVVNKVEKIKGGDRGDACSNRTCACEKPRELSIWSSFCMVAVSVWQVLRGMGTNIEIITWGKPVLSQPLHMTAK
ncbi:hypothetical protein HYDPIDRAFT_120102 [Hydnomerulius pinastri MD-312]|uniref:Uncharacterized protein n=1 Tax=Hydnomerulius pinastri MD-312 TaxID=994086 RepID=A0A0C9W6V7_9AGAM|nr:hypothetical protein HYDPIDRAFT_120102 [Hydnomerulius pinastri MD-312]